MKIKTRFAPSPTGDLHIGNIRTALYAWLFARSQGGTFVLRIEDTNLDYNTNNKIMIENIITAMKWLKLDWDEGPYFQSKRLDRYRYIINNMLERQLAYKCYCSQERLRALRIEQLKNKEKPKYDGLCRIKSAITYDHYHDKTVPYVIRFCNPLNGYVTFKDQIRGIITFNNHELDDLIICRANGIPTYNFCVVVDDIDMNITHVIRGEEHINNTPRQINIMNALQASIPIYAHLPMVLDSNKKKLSKRDKISSIIEFRDAGFLPEALLNYLVRLGWSYKNQEIFSIEQMKKFFCINKISKSASIFNLDKLIWLNRYYIQNLPTSYIIEYLSQYINTQSIQFENKLQLANIVTLFSKRCNTLKEMMCNYIHLCKDFDLSEKKIARQYLVPIMMDPLKFLRNNLNTINPWSSNAIKNIMNVIIKKFKINMSTIAMTVRVALIGSDTSPDINTVIYILGKNHVLHRIDQAICYIENIHCTSNI